MNFNQAQPIEVEKLHFDTQNPRLVEFNFTNKTPQAEIIELLWEEMAIDEIILSIKASGFFQNEPLIAIAEDDHYVVIEGNRRLTAVKAVLHPSQFKDKKLDFLLKGVKPSIKDDLKTLPVIVVSSRKEAWRYIGFKHVNGPVKWGSYAKAEYIAQVHNDFGVELSDISSQIGDTHQTVQKMYQGLMVIQQAEKITNFNRTDITAPRLYFSHLYTGLQLEGIRDYLGLKDFDEEPQNPVPENKSKELEKLMFWLFGSKKLKERHIIKSQNPDLKLLSETLQSKEGIAVLETSRDLTLAHESSLDSTIVLYQSLIDAKLSLQKVQSQMTTGYNGEEDTFNLAKTVAELSQDVYYAMRTKRNKNRSDFNPLSELDS